MVLGELRWLGLIALATGAAAFAEPVEPITAAQIHSRVAASTGKVVIVNFWATWCPPCLKEFPDIIALYNEERDAGLEVLAVSMNADDEMADVEAFLEEFHPPFAVRIASSLDGSFYEDVVSPWYGEIPITLVFDTHGKLVHYHRSTVTHDELAGEVAALLPAD